MVHVSSLHDWWVLICCRTLIECWIYLYSYKHSELCPGTQLNYLATDPFESCFWALLGASRAESSLVVTFAYYIAEIPSGNPTQYLVFYSGWCKENYSKPFMSSEHDAFCYCHVVLCMASSSSLHTCVDLIQLMTHALHIIQVAIHNQSTLSVQLSIPVLCPVSSLGSTPDCQLWLINLWNLPGSAWTPHHPSQ